MGVNDQMSQIIRIRRMDYFSKKTDVTTIRCNFWKKMATFYSDIWSHCKSYMK